MYRDKKFKIKNIIKFYCINNEIYWNRIYKLICNFHLKKLNQNRSTYLISMYSNKQYGIKRTITMRKKRYFFKKMIHDQISGSNCCKCSVNDKNIVILYFLFFFFCHIYTYKKHETNFHQSHKQISFFVVVFLISSVFFLELYLFCISH